MMRQLIVLFGRAVRAWWGEFLFLLLLNFVWLVAQVTIILGPPTTAAIYAIAQRVLDGDVVGFGDFWHAWRETAGRAWIWGAAQLLVYGIVGYNFWAYSRASGTAILALRYAWGLLALGWFVVNLYYWPLNLAQSDKRLTTTLSNAAKMALLNPNFTIVYALLALLFLASSILSGLFLGAVMQVWLALWSVLIVQDRLAVARQSAS